MSDALPPPQLGSRELFPRLSARAYLGHAAISPPSLLVEDATSRAMLDYAEHGVGAFPRWLADRDALRAGLAGLLGAAPEDFALTPGTTHSLTQVASSLPWRRGQRLVVYRGEFPANVTPWLQAAEHFGLEVVWLDLPRRAELLHDPVDHVLGNLERALERGVRLVAVSAVQFQTGLRMPLGAMGELCHRYGAELAVDAIQACGIVPLDVARDNIDYLACGGHKWLMGLEGVGFTYVRSELARALVPRLAGWLSHEGGADFLTLGGGLLHYDRSFKRDASVLEGSSSNAVGLAALHASLAALRELGIAQVFEHVQAYLDALEPALEALGYRSLRAKQAQLRSGILSLELPAGIDGAALVAKLRAAGVVVSYPDGLVRIAPHFPNALSEVPFVIAEMRRALAD